MDKHLPEAGDGKADQLQMVWRAPETKGMSWSWIVMMVVLCEHGWCLQGGESHSM